MGVAELSVEPYTTFLVITSGDPYFFGIDRSAITWVNPSKAKGNTPAGALVRRALDASTADIAVLVDDPEALTVGWLTAAAQMISDGNAAVVVGVDKAFQGSIAPIGAATAFQVATLREIGGFQPVFDSSAATLDALWRLQTRGLRVGALPGYAVESSNEKVRPSDLLAVAASNLSRENLDRLMADLVLGLATAPLREHNVDTTLLDLERSPGGDDVGHLSVPAGSLRGADEIDRALLLMSRIGDSRRIAEATRRLADRSLSKEIAAFVAQARDRMGLEGSLLAAEAFAEKHAPLIRICVVTEAAFSAEADKLWRELSGEFDVRWACVDDDEVRQLSEGDWVVVDEKIIDQRDWADAVVLKDILVRKAPWVTGRPLPVLVDASDWHFGEILEDEFPGMMGRSDNRGVHTVLVGETLERADRVLTRDEAHRDRILGWMAGLGRINPAVYDEDHSLSDLVAYPADDLPAVVAAWCRRPIRAADLVHSYRRSAPSDGVLGPLKNKVAKIWSRS